MPIEPAAIEAAKRILAQIENGDYVQDHRDTRDLARALLAAEKELVWMNGEWRDTIDNSFEALGRAKRSEDCASRLLGALEAQRRGYGGCFCEVAIDNPMMQGRHSGSCLGAEAAVAEAKAVLGVAK